MKEKTCGRTFLCGISYLFMCLCLLGISSCSDDKEGDGSDSSKSIKLQKLNLDNAKFLSLTGKSAESRATEDAEVGLFKIDGDGNLSTVVLTCVEEEDGTAIRTRNDIRVIPHLLYSLQGVYTLMLRCDFVTEDGALFDMLQYYEPEIQNGAFNILVRNSDGKVFYIPWSAGKYFDLPEVGNTALNSKGDLYIFPHRNEKTDLLMITLLNGELVIKQVNPNDITTDGYEEIWPLDNGTVITGNGSREEYSFFYPNGGFEQIPLFDKGPIYLSKMADGVKAVQLEERLVGLQLEYIVSLHDYNVGSSVGKNILSQSVASISSGTDYSTHLGDANYVDWVSKASTSRNWISQVYETSSSYLLGACLLVDKRTKQITELGWERSNHVIIPTEKNTYKGRAWSVSATDASWFNVETLEYGTVNFNLSTVDAYRLIDFYANIPSGEVTITGVRNSDGKQMICIVNIETGRAVCSVSDSERLVTTLIPLN